MFNVKLYSNLKYCWTLGTHKTPTPNGFTPNGTVSRESVGISFTHAILNSTYVFLLTLEINAYKKYC